MAQINFGTGTQGSPPTEEQKNLIRAALDLFSTADHDKLDAIEAQADVTDTENVVAALTAGNNITIDSNGTISSTDTSLSDEQVQDIIGAMVTGNTESGITVTYDDATGSIVFSVESQTDENFTTADHAKLDGIEDGATADQTNSEIATAYHTEVPLISQTDAEAGTGTAIESWSAQRVAQSIAANAGVSVGSETDVDGVLFGDGSQLSAATASEIRIAADLDTTNSPTFSGLSLPDGSTITAGDGTGIANMDGKLTVSQGLSLPGSTPIAFDGGTGLGTTAHYSIQKSGVRMEFRSNDTTPGFVIGNHKTVIGADSTLSFSSVDSAAGTPDTAFSRASAGHLQLGNGTLNDASGKLELADIDASGDFTLSDGSTITVGDGSGFVDLDGTISLNEGASVATGKPIVFNGATVLNSTSGYSIIRSGARLEFRTTSPTPFFAVSAQTAVIGGTSTLSFSSVSSAAGSRDVALSRASAGHLELGNGTLNDSSGTLSLSDLIASGDITVTGTVDGRDIATDGTKLDGIEAGADVTDTDNVVAALTAGTNITIASDGTISSSASGGGGANDGDSTDITGLLRGNGSTLSAASSSDILSDAGLGTTSSPTFAGLTVNGNIAVPDDASIDIGNTTTDLLELNGIPRANQGISIANSKPLVFNGGTTLNTGSTYSLLKSGSRLEFRTTNSNCQFVIGDHFLNVAADTKFGFAPGDGAANTLDVAFSRAEAGHLELGNGTLNDSSGTLSLSDLNATGDITLSDGATFDVGSGTGTLNINADLVSIQNTKLSLGSSGHLQFSAATDQGKSYSIRKQGVRMFAHGSVNNDAAWMWTSTQFHFHSSMVLGWGSGTGASASADIGFSRGGSGHLKLGNGTQDDASGNLELADLIASGNVDFSGLPTSDPAVAGRLYNDSGTLKVSAG